MFAVFFSPRISVVWLPKPNITILKSSILVLLLFIFNKLHSIDFTDYFNLEIKQPFVVSNFLNEFLLQENNFPEGLLWQGDLLTRNLPAPVNGGMPASGDELSLKEAELDDLLEVLRHSNFFTGGKLFALLLIALLIILAA